MNTIHELPTQTEEWIPIMKKISADYRRELDSAFEKRKNIILTSQTDIVITGEKYYVSDDGDDLNDGRSAERPWKTLNRVNSGTFNYGDAVLFRRGGTFRGSLDARSGVTYSAYGEGDKPVIMSSPYNGAEYGYWTETDVKNIYVFSEKFTDDVGMLVFNGGELYGYKALIDYADNTNKTDNREFTSYASLNGDLSFWHDLGGPNIEADDKHGELYLLSENGNPSERFNSIEFSIRTNAIRIRGDGVRINNLNVKYCGCHGIGAGTVNGLKVDRCVFEWIGGSVQYYRNGHPVRFGNAVEIYGGCSDYTVENCYINQAYDAGITHQFSSGGNNEVIMKNVVYKGNLIENCIYSIEYFLGKPDGDVKRHMSGVRIYDNIMRRCGYGFGSQRPDKGPDVHIKSWDHFNDADDMIFENNIMDSSAHMLIHIAADDEKCIPEIRNNVFIQKYGAGFARTGKTPTKALPYTEEGTSVLSDNNVFYFE